MRQDIQNPPIISLRCALKSLVGGGMMSLGVFTPWDPVAMIVLFILGFIIFVDSLMPVDRTLYAVTSVFFFMISGITGFFTSLTGSGLVYLVILLVVGAFVYLDAIRRIRKMGLK